MNQAALPQSQAVRWSTLAVDSQYGVPVFTARDVEARLHTLFVDAPGTTPRDEDRKKAHEVAAFLNELSRVSRRAPLVDVAAGKSALGALAAELLHFEDIVIVERDPARVAHCRAAFARLSAPPKLTLLETDLANCTDWPRDATVVALHACGPATDLAIDGAIEREAKWIFTVPCCHSEHVKHWARARAWVQQFLMPSHGELELKLIRDWLDAERALRLEAAGYETTAVALVPPTVTPHHVLLRARRLKEPKRQAEAARRHHAWLALTEA